MKSLLLAALLTVSLKTPTGELQGTLLVPPHSKGPVPVALIIAGSGPTDRDGNSRGLPGPNNSLKMLAETLAANGIASLRYDKRGIGASAAGGMSESDFRFDHLVADATAWIRQLRADERFSTITVIGHSEGSLLGMIAAREAEADGFVSIAGAGRSAPVLIREQLQSKLPKEMWNESERILARLLAGESEEKVPAMLMPLYRPSVQPYLMSWFRFDPAVEIAKLEVPVLVVQGTTDIQTTKSDAEALHKAARGSQLMMAEGMNHVLKTVDDDFGRQLASYSDPALPLHEGLGKRLAAFINGP